jgi:hypothetical protein
MQAEGAQRVFVRPKGVCTLCTPLCAGGFSACILGPFSWFGLHYFMKVSVPGDMTLRPRAAVIRTIRVQRKRSRRCL